MTLACLLLPRLLLAALAAVFIVTGSPWLSLFPFGALALGLGCPSWPRWLK